MERTGISRQQLENAQVIMQGIPKILIGGYGTFRWMALIPSGIPPMELKNQRLAKLNSAKGVKTTGISGS